MHKEINIYKPPNYVFTSDFSPVALKDLEVVTNTYHVYSIWDIRSNEICYIGRDTFPGNRLNTHFNVHYAKSNLQFIHLHMLKEGFDNFGIVVLAESGSNLDSHTLNSVEHDLINLYRPRFNVAGNQGYTDVKLFEKLKSGVPAELDKLLEAGTITTERRNRCIKKDVEKIKRKKKQKKYTNQHSMTLQRKINSQYYILGWDEYGTMDGKLGEYLEGSKGWGAHRSTWIMENIKDMVVKMEEGKPTEMSHEVFTPFTNCEPGPLSVGEIHYIINDVFEAFKSSHLGRLDKVLKRTEYTDEDKVKTLPVGTQELLKEINEISVWLHEFWDLVSSKTHLFDVAMRHNYKVLGDVSSVSHAKRIRQTSPAQREAYHNSFKQYSYYNR